MALEGATLKYLTQETHLKRIQLVQKRYNSYLRNVLSDDQQFITEKSNGNVDVVVKFMFGSKFF